MHTSPRQSTFGGNLNQVLPRPRRSHIDAGGDERFGASVESTFKRTLFLSCGEFFWPAQRKKSSPAEHDFWLFSSWACELRKSIPPHDGARCCWELAESSFWTRRGRVASREAACAAHTLLPRRLTRQGRCVKLGRVDPEEDAPAYSSSSELAASFVGSVGHGEDRNEGRVDRHCLRGGTETV